MALSKCLMYTYLIGMILWGTANTILLSLQFAESSLDVKYIHPWFQTITMFFGEAYCLVVYYVMKFMQNRKRKLKLERKALKDQEGKLLTDDGKITGKSDDSSPNDDEDEALEAGPTEEVLIDGTPTIVPKEASPFLMFIPSMCDFGGSTLLAFALLNMQTSIYQMLRG